MPSAAERQLLLAPDPIARAAAGMAPEPEQRWMLRQPRAVRRSFHDEVLAGGGDEDEQAMQVWMLHQPLEVRRSYAEHVLAKDPATPREMVWILGQPDAVCRSFARFVLLGEPG